MRLQYITEKTEIGENENFFFFSGPIYNYSFSSVLSCEDLIISSLHRCANMWIFIYLKSSYIFQLDLTEVTNCYNDDYEITFGALFHKQSW